MSAQASVGRINKEAFLVSIGFFLGLAIIGVIGHFVVRFGVQRHRLQIDDGLITLSFVFLLASQIIIYNRVVNPMFLMAAVQNGVPGVQAPLDAVEISETYHRWTVASLMISWCSICAVKFFFLIFFKRLIDRLRPWQIYWWIVFTVNLILLSFGITVYYVSCPYWGDKALQCATGKYMSNLVRYSAAQISLDIVGDLLILVIPVGLIWKIRVDWTQKLALGSSLCLTFVLVALSITRVAGLKYHKEVDLIWETYWQSMSAELGVFLAAASAFRTFFVSQKQNKPYIPTYSQRLKGSANKGSMGSERKQADLSDTWVGTNPAVGGFERLASNGKDFSQQDDPEWHAMLPTNSSRGPSPVEEFECVEKPKPVRLPDFI
ncbi:uncharacterized protein N7484_010952 [Penicillium longicatenatum]|uniref:uncharacterized protein n=1 Tax=Penicillium longicatenatum TaxID=1561947 RepID=UPI00254873E7|nr:uncharacterized protein N7484_010952 [Penicillium longicatenatum]KAJ5630852.1 hypothetical protein N7484_010952 [Penicillium longicatenatum]